MISEKEAYQSYLEKGWNNIFPFLSEGECYCDYLNRQGIIVVSDAAMAEIEELMK